MKKFHLQANENDENFIKIDHLLYDGKRYLMYRDITQNKVRCTGTAKNSGGRELAREYPLNLVRLKKFVQVSECTGFCVDTENAAV